MNAAAQFTRLYKLARDHYVSKAARKAKPKTPKTNKGKTHTPLTENLRNKYQKRKYSQGSNTKKMKLTIEQLESNIEMTKELYSGAKAWETKTRTSRRRRRSQRSPSKR